MLRRPRVQVQFYVLLITALLQLHFKHRCLPPPPEPETEAAVPPETSSPDPTSVPGPGPAPQPGKSLDGRLCRALSFASPGRFLQTLGQKLRC